MDPLTILYAVLTIIIALCVIHLLIERKCDGELLKDIPGPKAYPIIGNFLDIYGDQAKLFSSLRKWAKLYPKIYRTRVMAISIVCLLRPEDIEVVLSSMRHIKKSKTYDFLHPWLQDGLLTSSGYKWQSRRKILTPAFHSTVLQEFCAVFGEQGSLLAERLQPECDRTETDIGPYITDFALHSICETAMGTKLEMANEVSWEYKNAIYRMGELLVHRLVRPWLRPMCLFALSPSGMEQRAIISTLHSFTGDVIRKRKMDFIGQTPQVPVTPSHKRRLAMLDLLLLAEHEGADIDELGIREEVDTFMFEGHDTISMAITFALLCLANNPEYQETAYQEQCDIFGESDRVPTIPDLNEMRYLERCIKESLRLYPSVPLISRSLSEPLRLKRRTIPAGQIVHIHIFDLHRDPDLYPDPEVFDPDRFLPEQCAARHPFAYIPFSAGPRNCIGQRFAIYEDKSVISTILRNYKLEAVTKPEDIVFNADIVLRSKYPIKIRFRPRLNKMSKSKINEL